MKINNENERNEKKINLFENSEENIKKNNHALKEFMMKNSYFSSKMKTIEKNLSTRPQTSASKSIKSLNQSNSQKNESFSRWNSRPHSSKNKFFEGYSNALDYLKNQEIRKNLIKSANPRSSSKKIVEIFYEKHPEILKKVKNEIKNEIKEYF